MKTRLCLLVGYWAIAFVFALFFSGYGDRSFVPFALLISWAGFFSKLINRLSNLGGAGLYFESLIIALFFFVFYYIGLLKLVSKISTVKKKSIPVIPGIIHLSGGLAFLATLDSQAMIPPGILDSEASDWGTSLWYMASYFVSLVITLLWLSIDWRFAKRAKQA